MHRQCKPRCKARIRRTYACNGPGVQTRAETKSNHERTFLPGIWNMMHAASITILTPAGGLLRLFTSTMSFLLRLLRLATASSSAGSALSKSACRSKFKSA